MVPLRPSISDSACQRLHMKRLSRIGLPTCQESEAGPALSAFPRVIRTGLHRCAPLGASVSFNAFQQRDRKVAEHIPERQRPLAMHLDRPLREDVAPGFEPQLAP